MEKKTSLFANSAMYGLMTGVVLVLFSVVMNLLDLKDSALSWLGFFLMGAGMWYGTVQWRDKGLGGFISFGKAWKSGFAISFFAALIISIFTFVYMGYIDKSIMDAEIVKAEQKMVDDGMSEEQISIAMGYAKMFMTPGAIAIMAIVMYSILGLLIALITAAITKKDDPNIFNNPTETPLDQNR